MDEEFLKEIEKWEDKVLERVIPRLYKTTKTFRDPRTEKCKDYRNRTGVQNIIITQSQRECGKWQTASLEEY